MKPHVPFDQAERLIRVPVRRRGVPVELRVHYEVTRTNGCDSFRILNIDEPEKGTSTVDLAYR